MLKKFLTFLTVAITLTSPITAKTIDLSGKPFLPIIGVVNMGIIEDAQTLLAEGTKLKEVVILVNSPGGSVDAGQLFVQAMEQLKSRGVKLICVSGVLAASMGFQILAHCDRILVLPSTLLLFHPVRISTSQGLTSDMLAYVKEQMDLIEPKLNSDLQKKFKFPKKYFDFHYRAETLHSASELAKYTDALEVYTDIKGLGSTDELLYTYRKPSFMDMFGGSTWAGLTYIAPQVVLDLFN
jgi:ATP-dependent protease ClpP protease subunit